MSSDTSRRSLIVGAAALSAALAVPAVAAVTGTKSASSSIGANEPPRRAINKTVEIANKMIAEYDRLGTLGRDIEGEDWEIYDALDEQLWELPSQSVDDVTAKARVLDQRLRCGGKVHSVLHVDFAWDIIDGLLASQVSS